jgi:aspartyl/asparaginyl beta-hydroxylase (cupin superfamily)
MADDPAQLNQVGMAALRRGDARAAIAAFVRAAAADPTAAILHYNLANAQALAGDTAAQAEALDAALDRDPFMVHALLARGRLAEARGDRAAALGDYRRVLAVADAPTAPPPPPALAGGIAHARAMIADDMAALGRAVDTVLGPALANTNPAAAARMAHAVDVQLGRRRVYVQQPLVLHYPYLPAVQFFDTALFPWLAELEAATPTIRAELAALLDAGGAGFAPYVRYPRGAPVNQWAELNHSDAWSARFLIEHGRPDPVMRQACPHTAALLDRLPLLDLPNRGPVAFFSLLKPRTTIPSHTGATNIRSIIHLPLIVPAGCTFRVGNETRHWQEGRALVFDDTIEHEAHNPSDALRAVLILDTWNPHLDGDERGLIRQWVAALDTHAAAHGRPLPGFSAA